MLKRGLAFGKFFQMKKSGWGRTLFLSKKACRESGIRTRDRLLTYTHFPGVLLQPLGHLSFWENGRRMYDRQAGVHTSQLAHLSSDRLGHGLPEGSGTQILSQEIHGLGNRRL